MQASALNSMSVDQVIMDYMKPLVSDSADSEVFLNNKSVTRSETKRRCSALRRLNAELKPDRCSHIRNHQIKVEEQDVKRFIRQDLSETPIVSPDELFKSQTQCDDELESFQEVVQASQGTLYAASGRKRKSVYETSRTLPDNKASLVLEKEIKVAWSPDEDTLLLDMVNKYGEEQWGRIVKWVPDRTNKQCSAHWFNHLKGRIEWRKSEDQMIIELHKKVGNKWGKMAKNYLKGRDENAIKNRWESTLRPQLVAKGTGFNVNQLSCQSGTIEQSFTSPLISDGPYIGLAKASGVSATIFHELSEIPPPKVKEKSLTIYWSNRMLQRWGGSDQQVAGLINDALKRFARLRPIQGSSRSTIPQLSQQRDEVKPKKVMPGETSFFRWQNGVLTQTSKETSGKYTYSNKHHQAVTAPNFGASFTQSHLQLSKRTEKKSEDVVSLEKNEQLHELCTSVNRVKDVLFCKAVYEMPSSNVEEVLLHDVIQSSLVFMAFSGSKEERDKLCQAGIDLPYKLD
ncbi:Myb-like DNA-binding domain-containing protein [Endozoicomonas sp.]|uniref:Myb-like DNA-binding domain-containing protein n=1 Tax=Endozoicomonas sp. TaxID=1892382 RepID=UPI002884B2EC|nr:Myb-like DNA-binding domain-containing protein [Endozoicomonas sp.]